MIHINGYPTAAGTVQTSESSTGALVSQLPMLIDFLLVPQLMLVLYCSSVVLFHSCLKFSRWRGMCVCVCMCLCQTALCHPCSGS